MALELSSTQILDPRRGAIKGSVYLSKFGDLIQSSLSEAQVAAKSAPDLQIGTGVRLRNFRINTRQGPAFAFLAKRGPD